MRIPARLAVLVCCCAALAACTAVAPNRPDASVTMPSVGRPPPSASSQAALSSEAFTPYAGLGNSTGDGLAPGEANNNLFESCVSAAGYPDASVTTVTSGGSGPVIAAGDVGLAFAQPWGSWGYLGSAEAQQYGFLLPPTTESLGASQPDQPSTLAAGQAAVKCFTIVQDFANAVQSAPLAGINAIRDDIGADMLRDPTVNAATRAWAACMARNGYRFGQPQNVAQQATPPYGMQGQTIQVNPSANQAQIATAVTDADCTQSTDLAGIYFAVQASYELQLVTANQQALASAVSQYHAAYANELRKLPALLRATKAPSGRRAPSSARHQS
jgi:hypothetical protein